MKHLKKYNEAQIQREKIHIDKHILSQLLTRWGDPVEGSENYEFISNEITSSDPEDGGADHTVIIKRRSDGVFFRFYYSDWDMDYNFERDFPEELTEVFPRQIITTIYE